MVCSSSRIFLDDSSAFLRSVMSIFDSRISAELPLGTKSDLVRKFKIGGSYIHNYIEKNTDNCHIIDNAKEFLLHETVHVNTYYENKRNDKNDYNSTYHYKLILSHRKLNTTENYLYYERCIARLYNLLKSDINKYYIHFHLVYFLNYLFSFLLYINYLNLISLTDIPLIEPK